VLQVQEQPQKRRRKKATKLEFEAGKVFNVKPAEDLELDLDMATYRAQKGQGGDRRT